VINIEDVDEVIQIMGQPSDFAPDDDSRDDETFIRYQKRLYRDPENKVIGGVCSGIGAYFNLDPIWVRILFVLLVLAPGFGILLYIILWLVVPEARTAAERLEMRGHPVTISTLENSFRQEVGDIKDKVNQMAGKARESYKKKKDKLKREDTSYVADNLKSIGRFFLRVLGIFSGVIIFLLAASLSLLFVFIFLRFPGITIAEHIEVGFFPFFPFLSMLLENDADMRTLGIGLIILIGIPLLLLMLAGIRLVFRIPSIKHFNSAAGWVWLITLLITIVFSVKIGVSFSRHAETTSSNIIDYDKGDTLELALNPNLPTNPDWTIQKTYMVPEWGIYLADYNKNIYGIPQLRIYTSKDSSIHLNERYFSRGRTYLEAMDRTEAIKYSWSLDSNRLGFNESFTLPPGEKWRRQELVLELELPEGCIFRTDNEIHRIMTRTPGISRHKIDSKLLLMTGERIHVLEP
jgi:phage shock protein PspC (stress-responsive transcriptional regulator)